jgi:predicted small secreted protein
VAGVSIFSCCFPQVHAGGNLPGGILRARKWTLAACEHGVGRFAKCLRNVNNIRLQDQEIGVSKISMKITLLITVAAAGVLLSSCNTMIGLGRDMRMGGEGLEKTANKTAGGGSSGGDTSGAPVY